MISHGWYVISVYMAPLVLSSIEPWIILQLNMDFPHAESIVKKSTWFKFPQVCPNLSSPWKVCDLKTSAALVWEDSLITGHSVFFSCSALGGSGGPPGKGLRLLYLPQTCCCDCRQHVFSWAKPQLGQEKQMLPTRKLAAGENRLLCAGENVRHFPSARTVKEYS